MGARGAGGLAGLGIALRPGQRGAVGLRRVGGGEHERRRGRARLAGVGTQALDRAGQRELRTAEALDEVAAPADAEGLEVAERVVERGEAARDALGEDLLTGDDAVALEQQLGQRAALGPGLGAAAEDPARQRPTALDGRLGGRAARAEAPARLALPGAARAGEREARRAQGRPRVVGALAGPDEVPQRLLKLLGRQIELGEEVGEEARRAGEALAQRIVLGLVGRLLAARRRRRADRLGVLAEVQGDAAAVAPQRARADPDDLPGRAQLVQPRRRVGARPARQDVALPDVGGQREALERDEHLAQAVDARTGGRMTVHALPAR